MIVTGAPVEDIPFEEVDYWKELQEIFNWARENVRSTLYICWAAQAGLYHFYDIPKYPLPKKMFGYLPYDSSKARTTYSSVVLMMSSVCLRAVIQR